MRLTEVHVQRFRSLYDARFSPGDFSALVGPNGAGKSNLLQSFSFLADVFAHDIETAMMRRGGVEGVFYRNVRRTRSGLRFAFTARLELDDFNPDHPPEAIGSLTAPITSQYPGLRAFKLDVSFKITAEAEESAADYSVASERVVVTPLTDNHRVLGRPLVVLEGGPEGLTVTSMPSVMEGRLGRLLRLPLLDMVTEYRQSGGSSLDILTSIFPPLREVSRYLAPVRIYSVSPTSARADGAASKTAELQPDGGNLPGAIRYLMREAPAEWQRVLDRMCHTYPTLTDIHVQVSSSRRLTLSFVEGSRRRGWTPFEVSDGTVKALALLVALSDPRSRLVLLEEPENSLHPWAIRTVVEACRESGKQVIMTTHSPTVMNLLRPSEVDVVWRERRTTRVKRLLDLDPQLGADFERGEADVGRLLDSGWIEQAVPRKL